MQLAYNQISQSAGYKEDETSVSLTVCGGSYGGAARCLYWKATRTMPEQRIRKSAPVFQRLWEMGGGYVPMIVQPICFRPKQTIKVDGGGVAFTLESREFKAPQCVVIRNELSESDRLSEPRGASRELQRTGCVQRYVGD